MGDKEYGWNAKTLEEAVKRGPNRYKRDKILHVRTDRAVKDMIEELQQVTRLKRHDYKDLTQSDIVSIAIFDMYQKHCIRS